MGLTDGQLESRRELKNAGQSPRVRGRGRVQQGAGTHGWLEHGHFTQRPKPKVQPRFEASEYTVGAAAGSV